MSLIFDEIIVLVEQFNDLIREALAAKKINNTKEASNSLRIEKDLQNNIIRSIGIFYLEFLDTGRGSGKQPPFDPISIWVKQKLGITEEEENKAATYAIMNKIAHLGTEIFINNQEGIELEKKVLFLREQINNSLAKYARIEVLQKLDKFKNIYKFSLS